MSVRVADIQLGTTDQLSPKARLLLNDVEGGESWLRWAISAPQTYAFATEPALVESIQGGLHGSRLILFRRLGLQVAASRLWELDEEVLAELDAAEKNTQGPAKPPLKIRRLLVRNHLWSQQELESGTDFLVQLGVETEPVFQSMTLGDRIEVFYLSAEDLAASSPAAEFALRWATNPIEFADLYRFYLAVEDAGAGEPGRAARHLRRVLRGALRAPYAAEDLNPEQAGLLARSWLDESVSTGASCLGFPTLSHGLQQVARFSAHPVCDRESAEAALVRYCRRLRDLLFRRDPEAGGLTQDGATQLFPVRDEEDAAVLIRNRSTGALVVWQLTETKT